MKRAIILLVLILSCACGMPETRIYSINMPAPAPTAGKLHSDASVAIGITSPRYLSQPYMAHRTSPYQLLISRYAKWDASPEEIVRDGIKDSIISAGLFKQVRTSSVVPGGFHSIKINLKRFEMLDEGNDSYGEVAFDVDFFSPEGKELFRGSVIKRTKLENKSFVALAKGLSGALAEGMEEARANVEKSLKQ